MILAGGDWCILARVAGGPARQNYGYDGWLQRESHTAPRFQLRAPLLRTHSLLNPPSQFSLSLSLSRSLSLFQGERGRRRGVPARPPRWWLLILCVVYCVCSLWYEINAVWMVVVERASRPAARASRPAARATFFYDPRTVPPRAIWQLIIKGVYAGRRMARSSCTLTRGWSAVYSKLSSARLYARKEYMYVCISSFMRWGTGLRGPDWFSASLRDFTAFVLIFYHLQPRGEEERKRGGTASLVKNMVAPIIVLECNCSYCCVQDVVTHFI